VEHRAGPALGERARRRGGRFDGADTADESVHAYQLPVGRSDHQHGKTVTPAALSVTALCQK
jgi:hypothetical protein